MAVVAMTVFFMLVIGIALTPIAFMINRPRLAYTALACAFLGFAGFAWLASVGASA